MYAERQSLLWDCPRPEVAVGFEGRVDQGSGTVKYVNALCLVRQATTASKGTHGLFLSSAEPVSLLLSRLVAHPSARHRTPRAPFRLTGRRPGFATDPKVWLKRS